MAVEQSPKEKEFSPKEQGTVADAMIEFALVPNRRVVLEGVGFMLYQGKNSLDSGEFNRTLVLKKSADGEERELSVTAVWKGKEIIEGSVELALVKNGRWVQGWHGKTEEETEVAWDFLRSAAYTKT